MRISLFMLITVTCMVNASIIAQEHSHSDHNTKSFWSTSDNQITCHAANGNLEKVKELIAVGQSVDKRSDNNWTPLIAAAYNDRVEVVTELIKQQATIDSEDNLNMTAIMYAAMLGHIHIFKQLKAAGACLTKKNLFGQTIYDLAQRSKHTDILNELSIK